MKLMKILVVLFSMVFICGNAFAGEGNEEVSDLFVKMNGSFLMIRSATAPADIISELTRTVPDKDANGNFITGKKFKIPTRKNVEIAPGLAAISFNLKSKKFAFFDSIAPLTLTINYNQKTYVDWTIDPSKGTWEKSINNFTYAWSVGVTASKSQDREAVFGLSVVPLLVRWNEYAIGIGVEWRNESDVAAKRERLNLIVPITYKF